VIIRGDMPPWSSRRCDVRGLLIGRGLSALTAVGLALCLVGPVAAQSNSLEVVFRETFGRGAAPSGVGNVRGAIVTEVFTFTGEVPTGDPRCPARTTGSTTATWPDGSTITTEEHWLICFPGSSRSAPGGLVSYGNPETSSGTYTLVGGTGAFAGITGSGTITATIAGDILVIHYSGTFNLP
jgi:hypothetical protein